MEKIVDFSKLSMKKIRELIVFTVLIVVALWKFDVVLGVIRAIWGIIFPFVLGGAIAFVIAFIILCKKDIRQFMS